MSNTRPVPLSEFVTLGQQLYILTHPQVMKSDVYSETITGFLRQLETCGLQSTKAAASALDSIRFPYVLRTNRIEANAARQLELSAQPISHALYAEASGRQMIALNTGVVSRKLRALSDQLALTDTQQHLLDECARCIECGAYRAGAVMGWNLAYDYICSRMFNARERKAKFNGELKKKKDRSGNQLYPKGIVKYDQFFTVRPALGERDVLDTMKDSGLLTGIYETLCGYLRERNKYAHASKVVPSADQTNGYVDNLIDIITNPPIG